LFSDKTPDCTNSIGFCRDPTVTPVTSSRLSIGFDAPVAAQAARPSKNGTNGRRLRRMSFKYSEDVSHARLCCMTYTL
jgi:hypothetical protein